MPREADDAELFIRLVRVEQMLRANNMLLTAILARLERAGIGEPTDVDATQDNGG